MIVYETDSENPTVAIHVTPSPPECSDDDASLVLLQRHDVTNIHLNYKVLSLYGNIMRNQQLR